MNELEKVREIFLADVDEETREDNALKIKEWEEGLIKNEAYLDWQDHDITKEITLRAKEAYKEIALILATNRELTDRQRFEMWGKQDAALWILSIANKDARTQVEEIRKEIKVALSV